MSAIKLRSVQYGNSLTSTNNFVLKTPDIPDGTLRLYRGVLDAVGTQIFSVASNNSVTFSSGITGTLTGNADTVTNGVYTTGTQTIGGTKTFSTSPTVTTGTDAYVFINANSTANYAATVLRQGGISRGALVLRTTSSDVAIDRYNSAGTYLSSPVRVQNSDGNVYMNEGGGNLFTNGQLYVGVGATASYVNMTDTDEGMRTMHCNSNRIGFLNQSNNWGSYCADDGSWYSDQNIIAANGIYGMNVIYANPSNGYQFTSPGYAYDGAGGYYCTIALGAPNYSLMSERFWHQSGSWVGWQLQSTDGKTLRWSAQSGTLNADAFTPWSDSRLKDDIKPIEDARSKVAALTGSTYFLKGSTTYEGVVLRKAGLIAQDVLDVLPEAVSLEAVPEREGEGEQKDEDGSTLKRYTLDYNSVVALLVNDNNEMAKRIDTMLARIDTLEAQLGSISERDTPKA